MFETISRTNEVHTVRLYEIIVERIKDMIQEGKLKAGDRLPSERELAEMFRVSRVPVREALKILEFMEIVHHVRGDGVYLKSVSVDEMFSKIDFMVETTGDIISDLFEARQALEITAAGLAAIRRTDVDLQAMEDVIADMEKDVKAGGVGIEAATAFHTAVSKASKNKVIARINDLLVHLSEISRKKSMKGYGGPSVALGHHKKILSMIRKMDAEGAKTAMAEHLKSAERAALKFK